MGSFTQVYFNGRKVMLKLQFMLGQSKTVLVVVLHTTKLNYKIFGPFKRLANKRPRLRPCQNWSKWPILPIFEQKLLKFSCFF